MTFSNARLLAGGIETSPPFATYLVICLANSGQIIDKFADNIDLYGVRAKRAPAAASQRMNPFMRWPWRLALTSWSRWC